MLKGVFPMQHIINYNETNYLIEVATDYESKTYLVTARTDESTKEQEILTKIMEMPALDITCVMIDEVNFPGIENVLIEANILEPDLLTVIFDDYPVYQLTNEAIQNAA
jgi:thymidine kinase